MSEPISRRKFLRRTAAASALLALPFLARFADAKRIGLRGGGSGGLADDPNALSGALARMKEEDKPGVLILFPSDPAATLSLAGDLTEILASKRKESRLLLCQAVFVTLPVGKLPSSCQAPEHSVSQAVVFHLDSSGKPVDKFVWEVGLSDKKLVDALREMLHGRDGSVLRARMETQRATLGARVCGQIDAALLNLGADEFRPREKASDELLAFAPTATAILAWALRQTSDPEIKHRLDEIFKNLFNAAPADKPGPRLPHGFRPSVQSRGDSCPACGMGFISPDARLFLNLLNK